MAEKDGRLDKADWRGWDYWLDISVTWEGNLADYQIKVQSTKIVGQIFGNGTKYNVYYTRYRYSFTLKAYQMKRNIPKTDRWAIGDNTLEMYWAGGNSLTEDDSKAATFTTSFEASNKMHELQKTTDHELMILDLDPSPTYLIAVQFNEY